MATGEDLETTTANACYTGWQTNSGGMFHRYCTCPGTSGRKLLSSGDDAQGYDACTCSPYTPPPTSPPISGARRLQTHPDTDASKTWWEAWAYIPNDFAEWLKETMWRRRLKIAWRDKETSINLAQCDLDNVLCKSGGMGVTNAGEVMGLAVVIFLGACQLMSIQFVGMTSHATHRRARVGK
jgi:hypothetical protein